MNSSVAQHVPLFVVCAETASMCLGCAAAQKPFTGSTFIGNETLCEFSVLSLSMPGFFFCEGQYRSELQGYTHRGSLCTHKHTLSHQHSKDVPYTAVLFGSCDSFEIKATNIAEFTHYVLCASIMHYSLYIMILHNLLYCISPPQWI